MEYQGDQDPSEICMTENVGVDTVLRRCKIVRFLLGKGILVLIIFIDGYVEGEAFSRSIAVFQVPGA